MSAGNVITVRTSQSDMNDSYAPTRSIDLPIYPLPAGTHRLWRCQHGHECAQHITPDADVSRGSEEAGEGRYLEGSMG